MRLFCQSRTKVSWSCPRIRPLWKYIFQLSCPIMGRTRLKTQEVALLSIIPGFIKNIKKSLFCNCDSCMYYRLTIAPKMAPSKRPALMKGILTWNRSAGMHARDSCCMLSNRIHFWILFMCRLSYSSLLKNICEYQIILFKVIWKLFLFSVVTELL